MKTYGLADVLRLLDEHGAFHVKELNRADQTPDGRADAYSRMLECATLRLRVATWLSVAPGARTN